MNSKEQYNEAVRIAKDFKREKDAEIGDWFNEPKFILLHEYKNKSSPQAWLAATEHRSPWVEEASAIKEEIDWEEVLGPEEALVREEFKKDVEEHLEEKKKYLKDFWDKDFGTYSLLEEWIPRSKNHRFWWDVLEVVAAYALRQGEVQDNLATWLADYLEGKTRKPRKGAGYYAGRDFLLAKMVSSVCDEVGINATRNDGSPPYSACDAVGEVVGLGYKAIETAWFEYGLAPHVRRNIRAYVGIP